MEIISGNLTVGGVLTYEDVTSIDSVGIITAQKEILMTGDCRWCKEIWLGNAGVIQQQVL